MAKIGDRVYAILSGDDKAVKVFGPGTYVGDFVPDEKCVGWMAEALRDLGTPNPKIELDGGETVYGCECWWGDLEKSEERIAKWKKDGREIIIVSVEEARKGEQDV